jgi:DNA-binding NtrC family response regulator
MSEKSLLEGKRVLIVDDEKDVLDSLEQLLFMCEVAKATDFESAKALLESRDFDIAVLDIMGVNGYGLLDLAQKKNVIAVMLTAHALSPGHIVKSIKGGAASYLPKEELANIAEYLNDLLEDKARGVKLWWRWLDRWGSYYDRKFGPEWKDEDKEFWEKIEGFPW